jgi:group I intron endonuclease
MKYEKLYEKIYKQEVQEQIREENRQKAGIYMILNRVNGKRYVGSASTNRINVRFRNHILHGTGAKGTAAAVAKYGIENFSFYILEYYPGLVKKENLSAAHVALLELETKYIRELKPEYNKLQEGTSSKGNKHTEETKREKDSQERRETIGNLKEYSAERRQLLSKVAEMRKANAELRAKLSATASKPVTLYKEDGSEHRKYSGIRAMAKEHRCCSKTINKAIAEGSIFKKIGKVRLDQSP